MAIDIRDLEDEVSIYYRCPHCNQVSGIIINGEPFEPGHDGQQLFCCEHCEGFSEIWILADELATKIRRLIRGETV